MDGCRSWLARERRPQQRTPFASPCSNAKMLAGLLPTSFPAMAATNRKNCSHPDPFPTRARAATAASTPISLQSQPAAKCSSCFSHHAPKLHTPSSYLKPGFFLLCDSATHFQAPYDRICYFAGGVRRTRRVDNRVGRVKLSERGSPVIGQALLRAVVLGSIAPASALQLRARPPSYRVVCVRSVADRATALRTACRAEILDLPNPSSTAV